MSLKAKLEAVIYAAEEPVTLNQLAALFAADALQWKAAQDAAAAEQTAEVAGVSPDAIEPLPLIEQVVESPVPLNPGGPAQSIGEGTPPADNDAAALAAAASEPAAAVPELSDKADPHPPGS